MCTIVNDRKVLYRAVQRVRLSKVARVFTRWYRVAQTRRGERERVQATFSQLFNYRSRGWSMLQRRAMNKWCEVVVELKREELVARHRKKSMQSVTFRLRHKCVAASFNQWLERLRQVRAGCARSDSSSSFFCRTFDFCTFVFVFFNTLVLCFLCSFCVVGSTSLSLLFFFFNKTARSRDRSESLLKE